MESRQSRKSGNRPRVCRTCGQHHSHHEPHIYDYKEEVSSSTYRIPVEKLSLKIQSKVLQQRKDPHSKWLVPSFVIGLTRRITTSSWIIVFWLPSSWYWYWYWYWCSGWRGPDVSDLPAALRVPNRHPLLPYLLPGNTAGLFKSSSYFPQTNLLLKASCWLMVEIKYFLIF